MCKLLNLKLTNLNSVIKKCGFPVNSANKYFNILNTLKYEFEVVSSDSYSDLINLNSYIVLNSYKQIIDDFLKLNIEELSIREAFTCLKDFQKKFKEI